MDEFGQARSVALVENGADPLATMLRAQTDLQLAGPRQFGDGPIEQAKPDGEAIAFLGDHIDRVILDEQGRLIARRIEEHERQIAGDLAAAPRHEDAIALGALLGQKLIPIDIEWDVLLVHGDFTPMRLGQCLDTIGQQIGQLFPAEGEVRGRCGRRRGDQ